MTVRRFTFDLHEGADGRTVDDVMAIKPNFLSSMGYHYFLSYGAPRARSSAKNFFNESPKNLVNSEKKENLSHHQLLKRKPFVCRTSKTFRLPYFASAN